MYEMRKSGVGGVMQRFFVLLGILAISAAASHAAPAPQKPAAAKPVVPTDGQPRVIERRGKFVIRPDTLFCGAATVDPAIKKLMGSWTGPSINGGDLKTRLKEIGQSDYMRGAGRYGWSQDPKDCPDNSRNIFITGRTKQISAVIYPHGKDDARYPYRLELSARQGPSTRTASPFVKVVVERADGMSPDYSPFVFDGGADAAFLLHGSIMTDSKTISKILVEQLFSSK